MKVIRFFAAAAITLAALTVLAPSGRAASVGPAGYTNHFSSLPPAADWSYLKVSGAPGDITTGAALNTAVQALTAAGITTQLVSVIGNPPAMAGYATWSSTGGYLQTRPADIKFMALMAKLINNTGADQKSFQIGYRFSQQAIANEEINGHLVYYSLTGAANSWTNVPTLSSAAPGNLAVTISAPWPKDGTLYLLWADDNGSPSLETANQIDDFFVSPPRVPPSILSLAPMSATVDRGGPASFTVAAAGTPPLWYQWRKTTATSTNVLANQTDATFSIAAATLADAAGYSVVITNAFGSVTSAVATLSALSDVTPPQLRAAWVGYALNEIYLTFSEPMDPTTAQDPLNYALSGGVVVQSATLDASDLNLTLVTAPMTPGVTYTLNVTGVKDLALPVGNLISPNPTVLPFQLDYRNLGYLYLSPLPGAEYVSSQTRFVLVRFKGASPDVVTNLSTFITVTGSSSGIHSGQTHVAMDGRTVIYEMTTDFIVNELVTVTLTPEVGSATSLDPYQYQFVVAGHKPDVGTITARGDNPPDEGKENAFDGDPATKWLDYIVPNGTTNFSWIQYLYPGNATFVAGQYALTSADDAPERDPVDWNFYGVDASGYLVLLDRQTGQSFDGRCQTKVYTLTNSIEFRGYRLEITRVNDSSSATAVQLAELQFIERQGSLLREYWLNIPGTAVSDLTSNSNYPANPSGKSLLSSFEAPINWADNYGTRVRGYIIAPNTDTYVFWISSQNNSELWLSPDDNPVNKRLIASVPGWTLAREWSKYSQQQSDGIRLTAGQKYYVEALQKEGSVDTWYDYTTVVTTTGEAADNAVVWGTGLAGGWFTLAENNQAFVPVDFKYTTITAPTETAYVTGVILGPLRNDYSGWVGMQVVVGANPLTVTRLGRMMAPGNTAMHTVKLVKASDGTDVSGGSAAVAMSGGTAGQFQYENLSSPVTLAGGTAYWVLSQETAAGRDNLTVGWAKRGQGSSAPPEVIPGAVLSPWIGGASALSLKAGSLKQNGVTAKGMTMPNGVSVPSDFPQVVITARGNPSTDYIWLENVGQNGQMYKMILDNQGNPVFYQRGGAFDFKPQKNGMITWAGFTGVDSNFNYLRSYSTVNGYGTDAHELQIMEDGSYFLIGGRMETVDMRRFVTNGNPAASVIEDVIQQFTAADELIFQWRAWDHMDVLSQQQLIDLTSASFDFPHMNSVDVDDDGHILLSSRSSSECTKINRDTGEVIWRMGGTQSTLTFVNDPLNGPRQQHSFRALGHGHYILFDNGNLHSPSVSRAVEYVVDPVARTATLVWQFRDTPDKYAYYMGNVQRLTNGNTHINWVLAGYPKVCEVDSNGVKQLELNLTPGYDLYRSWRSPWDGVVPVPYLIVEPYPDNVTLIFNKFGDTNVNFYRIYGGTSPQPTTLLATTPATLAHLSNLQNNQQYYFRVTAVANDGTESGYSNEENLMVNLVQPGQNMVQNGDFSAGTDGWTWVTANTGAGTFGVVTGACVIHISSAGTALTDLQLRQSGLKLIEGRQYVLEFDGMAVGGTHPIDVKLGQDQSPFDIYYTASPSLRVTRQHFTYAFTMTSANDLNVRLMFNVGALARDIVLENISLTMAYSSEVTVTLAGVPGGLTVNVDGTDYTTPTSLTWATNSSHTLSAAGAQLSTDGHARYPFLSWSDGGAQTHTVTAPLFDTNYTANFSTEFLLDIARVPVEGGSVTLIPGGPWYPRDELVSLTANPNPGFIFLSWDGVDSQSNNTGQATMSEYRNVTAAFQAVGPIIIDARSLTRLPDGRIQFGISAGPGATYVTVWGTTTLSPPDWKILGTVPLTDGRGVFIDDPLPTVPTRFYRATFQAAGPIIIYARSPTRLPDGRIQIGVMAGPGVAQLTMWGTTTLSPPDWKILGTVPLTGGRGVFIDDPDPKVPARFYRASVP